MTTTPCAEVEGALVELLDRRLPRDTERRLRAHAGTCAACGASLARWERSLPALRGLAPPPPTPLALRRMELAIEHGLEASYSPPPWRSLLRWAVPAAAAACALVPVFAGPGKARIVGSILLLVALGSACLDYPAAKRQMEEYRGRATGGETKGP